MIWSHSKESQMGKKMVLFYCSSWWQDCQDMDPIGTLIGIWWDKYEKKSMRYLSGFEYKIYDDKWETFNLSIL